METPALFLQFADAHPASEEEIISLAKRFGFLFADQVGLAPVWAGGELVSLWCRETKALHDAVTLWEAPSRTLKKWFRVEQPGMSYSGPLGNYVVHHEGILNPSNLFGRPTSKLSEGASFVLQRSIDAKLREYNVSARFVWDSTRFTLEALFPAILTRIGALAPGRRSHRQRQIVRAVRILREGLHGDRRQARRLDLLR